MTNYAVIQNDKVVNIIVSDSKEIAEQITNLTCIEYIKENSVGIGWTYNGSTFEKPQE
jgi:hypothetical protein